MCVYSRILPLPIGSVVTTGIEYTNIQQVATNGIISFGSVFTFFNPAPFSNESFPAVYASFVAAPYWADIDNTFTGEIWYETHTSGNSTESNDLLNEVSDFVRVQQDAPLFNGSWMLVATWNESIPFNRNISVLEVSSYSRSPSGCLPLWQ